MQVAIVTGASSGLGAQFARVIAELRHDIDEIWLIARRRERLEQLAAEFPERTFRCVKLDLAAPEAYDKLSALFGEERPNIRILINNAGYERGQGVYTPGALYKCYRVMARVLPSSLVMAVTGRFF